MPITMHAKSDSDVTCSVDGAASSPPRSPRRPLYYVQSPSNNDKMSFGSSPPGSPNHQTHNSSSALAHYYHCSPIHHSRESSTSRFSASLRNPRILLSSSSSAAPWRKLQRGHSSEPPDDYDDENGPCHGVRLYLGFVLLFIFVFTLFSLILWGASKTYPPDIIVKNVVFDNFNVQAGNDQSGVATDMLTLNSTVKVFYRNPSTFFGVHVTATPLNLHYFQLHIASGHEQLVVDEEILPMEAEPEKCRNRGVGTSGTPIWWSSGPYYCQRAPRDLSRATEPDICDEVEGIHFGEIGKIQVLPESQMLCNLTRQQAREAP